jgi:YidC/Oxa1 family membrane protein insertase
MNFISTIFHQLIYRPLLNLLVVFYNLPMVDFGSAIIILTLFTKLITWRLDTHAIIKQREAQIKGAEIQEEMKEIQQKHKDDPVKQQEETMKLWKEKKFNPFAVFVPLIVQLIIFITLFRLLNAGIGPTQLKSLYSFVINPGTISPLFLRFLDLSKPNIVLAIITGIIFFAHSKITLILQEKHMPKKKKKKVKDDKKGNFQKALQNQMTFFLPVLITIFSLRAPAAVPLYWSLATLIGLLQLKLVYRKIEKQEGV